MGRITTTESSHLSSPHAERRPLSCGAERRAVPRFGKGLQVTLRTLEPHSNGTHDIVGYARNLSSGGVCLYTQHRLAPGQEVQISIFLEHENDRSELPSCFVSIATVVRANPIDARFTALALRFDSVQLGERAYAAFIER